METGKRYYAFVSYTEANLGVAQKLHKDLETYRLPKALVGTKGRSGIFVPKRLHPCYLDREELGGVSELPESIAAAVEKSGSLVVVCSPAAREAKWVEIEIRHARRHKIPLLAWVAEGVPPDCFPPALRGGSEPAACDPRGSRKLRRRALLRLIAGILAIDLDQLIQRDGERRRRQSLLAGSALTAVVLIVVLLALNLRNEQKVSESSRLANAAERASDPEEALRLGIGAMDAKATLEAERAISQAIDAQQARAIFTHGASVFRILFTPDGRTLLSGGDKGRAALWDTTKGSLRFRLRGLAESINDIALSKDGALAAAGDDAGFVSVWDVNTGQRAANLDHGGGPIRSILFSRDGTRLISVTEKGGLFAWNVRTGQQTWPMRLSGFTRLIGITKGGALYAIKNGRSIAEFDSNAGTPRKTLRLAGGDETASVMAPDEHQIAIGYKNGRIEVLDLTGGTARSLASPHTGEIETLAFSPDGRYLASGSDDHTVVVWNREDWSQADRQTHGGNVYGVAYSSSGKSLATGSADRTAVLRDPSGPPSKTFRGHTDAVFQVSFSPDEQTLATASWDGTVRTWPFESRQATHVLRHPRTIEATCLVGAGKLFLAAGRTFATLWDTESWQKRSEVVYPPPPPRKGTGSAVAACSPSGKFAAASDATGNVRMFSIGAKGLELVWQQPGGIENLSAMAIAADGEFLIAAGYDHGVNRLAFRSARTGEMRYSVDAHKDSIREVGFIPGESLVFSVSFDRTLKLWDPKTGSLIRTIGTKDRSDGLRRVAFNRSGDRALTIDRNGAVRLWEVGTGKELWVLKEQFGEAPVSFATDEKGIWTVSANGILQLIDAASPDRRLFSVPSGNARSFQLSPSGQRFAAGTRGSTSIWDRPTGIRLHTLIGHEPRFWHSDTMMSTIDGADILVFDRSAAALLSRARHSFPVRAGLPE